MSSKITDKIFAKIQQEIDNGYIRTSRHSKLPLTIYKYTKKAEADHHWTDETKMCRGLVLDDEHNIVILPPPKFYNIQEPESPNLEDNDDWECLEKLDGYYISIKKDRKYGLVVTSSGSFENQYTEAAEKLFNVNHLITDVSYFCELCQNFPGDETIIVAKHPTPRLVCWSIRPTTAGREVDILKVNTYPFESISEVVNTEEYMKRKVEGVVLYSPHTNDRIKMKTNWWFDVHAEIGYCSLKRVFELLRGGGKIDFNSSCTWYQETDTKREHPRYWDGTRIPAELQPSVLKWEQEVKNAVAYVNGKLADNEMLWGNGSDKDIATNLMIPQTYRSIILAKRHGKDPHRLIWGAAERFLFKKQ